MGDDELWAPRNGKCGRTRGGWKEGPFAQEPDGRFRNDRLRQMYWTREGRFVCDQRGLPYHCTTCTDEKCTVDLISEWPEATLTRYRHTLSAHCNKCGHFADLDLTKMDPTRRYMALKAICSRCRSRDVQKIVGGPGYVPRYEEME